MVMPLLLTIASENGHAMAIEVLLNRGAQKPPQKAKDEIYCNYEECEKPSDLDSSILPASARPKEKQLYLKLKKYSSP
jgi:hypothetical protein